MKICIIGNGISSIISTLMCLKYNYEVDVFFDPEKDNLDVGESSTPHFIGLIYEVLDIGVHQLIDLKLASIKSGVKFIGWGKHQDSFLHMFYNNNIACQFETRNLIKYLNEILKKNGVNYIAKKVTSYKQKNNKIILDFHDKEYDFIINCVGWESESCYEKPIFESVNSAILHTKNSLDYHDTYTIHRATEDGWQFELPFPQKNITKCGYLYNDKISDKNEILKKLNLQEYRTYSWTPKYSSFLIKNESEAFNGNRLFFLEPLQALSTYYMIKFSRYICEYLKDKNLENFYALNSKYSNDMIDYQLSLAYHYSYGSVYETNYWSSITKKSNEFLMYHGKLTENYVYNDFSKDIFVRKRHIHKKLGNYCKYGCFNSADVEILHKGMTGVDLKEYVIQNLI